MSALQDIAIDLKVDANPLNKGDDINRGEPVGLLSNTLNSLSIGKKVTFFFGVNLALALIAATIVGIALIRIDDRAKFTSDTHRSAFVAERLVVEISEFQRHSESLATTGGQARGRAALAELERAHASIAELKELANKRPIAFVDMVASFDQTLSQSREQVEGAMNDLAAGRASDLTVDNVLSGDTLNAARELAEQMELTAIDATDTNQFLMTGLLSFWIGIATILVVVTLFAKRYFDRHVSTDLSALANRMTRLAAGEQIADIQETNRRDEIGEMTRAVIVLHQAAKRLEHLSIERSEKAHEKLREQALLQQQQEDARLERERTLRKIADSFEHKVGDVVGKVARASSQLQSTATSMAASAGQASIRTTEVNSSMQNANSGATAAAAASDEFAMSIGEVSRQAASSAELARKATASTIEANATIAKLSQSAEQVGHIVELIQTIAQRTNLLALNASIEAARGGEAGRGFAVVASEVKELAMQTSRATEQVAAQIREMQDTTGDSVSALGSIADEVAELESVAVAIAGAVDEQSYAGQDLARSIDMAARSTAQVSDHIVEVQELSTSTGAAASQVLTSATALEQQAATLRSQVNGFLDEVRAG